MRAARKRQTNASTEPVGPTSGGRHLEQSMNLRSCSQMSSSSSSSASAFCTLSPLSVGESGGETTGHKGAESEFKPIASPASLSSTLPPSIARAGVSEPGTIDSVLVLAACLALSSACARRFARCSASTLCLSDLCQCDDVSVRRRQPFFHIFRSLNVTWCPLRSASPPQTHPLKRGCCLQTCRAWSETKRIPCRPSQVLRKCHGSLCNLFLSTRCDPLR